MTKLKENVRLDQRSALLNRWGHNHGGISSFQWWGNLSCFFIYRISINVQKKSSIKIIHVYELIWKIKIFTNISILFAMCFLSRTILESGDEIVIYGEKG